MHLDERIRIHQNKAKDIQFLSFNVDELEGYLHAKKWISNGDSIKKVEKPGEGNMNLLIRVVLQNDNSFILKQARPWVEKFPQIDAPSTRIHVEKKFYEVVSLNPYLKKHSPTLLEFDAESMVMMMQDLGESMDYTKVYQSDESFSNKEIQACIDYLNELSGIEDTIDFPENLELRTLNHQHIFHLPFIYNNGFNLDDIQSGLEELSNSIREDDELVDMVSKLGEIYLSKGSKLLHGDFYPGSLLNTKKGLKVIDPEFGFLGPAEWDIAIFVAHLYISQTDPEHVREAYYHFKKTPDFNDRTFAGFVGTEIIRRLIGLAQLPINLRLSSKKELLEQAVKWIKYGYVD